MGKLRRALPPVIPTHASFFDAVPQDSSVDLLDSEEVLTTFANACGQAGAAKCLPAGLIKGTATGPDVRTLITSTIDVSLPFPYTCHTRGLTIKSFP